jgi:GTP-binding protein
MGTILFNRAEYLCSAMNSAQLPADQGYEVAFVGRSNVGKSSAINSITRQKSLARTSKTPGRTQQIIFFGLSVHQRLVDLPGYGFAKVPLAVKQQWQQLVAHYLQHRESLQGVMLLIDSRHPLLESDWQTVHWCQTASLPVHILLTKADKLSYGKSKTVLQQVQRQLDHLSIPMSVQLFSATKALGIDTAQQHLAQWLAFSHVLEDGSRKIIYNATS